jgi:uncharacterized protein (TIGR03435 family)
MWRIALLLVLAGAAPAQVLKFEVASIRPSPRPRDVIANGGKPRVGTTIRSRRVETGMATPASLIRQAYRIEAYQLTGPEWMNTRFDIVANMPEDATAEQLPEMLQSLLAERFHLTFHRESHDETVYALIVGKDGAKLKRAAADVGPSDRPFPNGADGHVLMRAIGTDYGGFWTISKWKGRTVFEAAKISMPEFARFLTPFAAAPVIDFTGLMGYYEVGMSCPPNPPNVTVIGMRGGLQTVDTQHPADPSGVSIFSGVQELGLRLDRRKAPVERLIVDHLDKTPTMN